LLLQFAAQDLVDSFAHCSALTPWLAFHEKIDRLVLISGHDSVDTMWRHYYKGTTKAAATAFWHLYPPAINNRARLPSPAQWVTVNRIRVKDSYTDMEFLSDEFSEKFVPIGFI
jgi:hypothetical protein